MVLFLKIAMWVVAYIYMIRFSVLTRLSKTSATTMWPELCPKGRKGICGLETSRGKEVTVIHTALEACGLRELTDHPHN